jgi:hypothetical protein
MRDAIPDKLKDGTVMLYNTDTKTGSGKHWQVWCLQKPDIFFFDPFGTKVGGYPPQEIRTWGGSHGYTRLVAYEDDTQHIKSALCGFYSMYVAKKMTKYMGQLTPERFDAMIHKCFDKYPTDHNVQEVVRFSKAEGLL